MNERTNQSGPIRGERAWSMRAMVLALVLAMMTAVGVGGSPAWAGSGSDNGLDADPVLAAHLARDALLDLGLHQSPVPADYKLAATLLSIASDLDPTNADLARSVVESAWLAGDLDMMIRATRRVIKDDPKDTVALLRLVSSAINKQQTVEGRLKLYDRFLGDSGKSLDASVRSRLALDAALLEREQGNTRGFLERLRLATKLDVSNKSAASLSVQYYSDSASDPVTLLDYQFKLLFADPLDPNVYMTIARLLAIEGAYVPARRFLNDAIALFDLDAGQQPDTLDSIRITLNWQIDGPSSVVDELNPILIDQRAQAKARIEAYIKAQLPTDDLLKPEEVLFGIEIEKLRLLATFSLDGSSDGSSDNTESTQKILDNIERTVSKDIKALGTKMSEPGANQRVLLLQIVSRFTDFQAMRAVVGLESKQIRADLDEAIKQMPTLEPYFATIEPIVFYSDGQFAQAIESASKYPSSPTLDLIVAMSNEQLGSTDEAVKGYLGLSHAYALSGYGAFARSRLDHLGGGDKALSPSGKQMIQISGTIPDWVDQMITRPATFVFLDMIAPRDPIGALESPTMTIRLKNIAPIPLALGSSSPIDTSILIVPTIDDRAIGFAGKVVPKVLDLSNRLRLRPLEELIVRVPVDSPATQWLIKSQPSVTLRQRWRLLQGFRPRRSDASLSPAQRGSEASIYGIVKSPLGLTAESGIVQRLKLEETTLPVDQLIERLASPDESTRRRAVLASAARLVVPTDETRLSPAEKSTLIDALVELYTRAKNNERARMILLLPQRHQVPEMMVFDDQVVGSIISDALIDSRVDTLVFASALLTRTDAEDSPIFGVLDQASDPRLDVIAGIIKARLAGSAPTLGTVGPGVDSMLPPKELFSP